jgi:hypothetical protein
VNPIKFIILTLSGSFIVGSCSKEDVELQESDPAISAYFDRFESEATARGKNIDLNDQQIVGYFATLENNIVGQCAQLESGGKQIRIDPTYWESANDLEKEFLIFHELGHCALGRSHADSKDIDGVCTSIMNSGLGGCRKRYTDAMRAQLLDELFDQ